MNIYLLNNIMCCLFLFEWQTVLGPFLLLLTFFFLLTQTRLFSACFIFQIIISVSSLRTN